MKRKTVDPSKPEQSSITENLKKGITELLVLTALEVRPMYIYEMIRFLNEISDDKCKITYPYAAIYRLLALECINEAGKRVADDRLRSYFKITDGGRIRLEAMRSEYDVFASGVQDILKYCDNAKNQ